jgi:hypothetical protein
LADDVVTEGTFGGLLILRYNKEPGGFGAAGGDKFGLERGRKSGSPF